MRKRILEQWLYHYGFRFTEGIANLLIFDADRDHDHDHDPDRDPNARLFIRQAEHLHATELLRDRYLRPLMDLKTAKETRIFD